MKNGLALRSIDMIETACGKLACADGLLSFYCFGGVRAALYEAFLVGVLQVCGILRAWRDPAIADEESLDIPLVI